jgi:tRNA dimethylallyltransferase
LGLSRTAVVIGGPTASGKSALAGAIAREFGGVVINADSMQVYREIPILTAQPPAEAMRRIPHRLYGIMPLDQPCTAARWAELARHDVLAALASGQLPVVVGGTGLYLRALLTGLADVPAIPDSVRAAAKARLAELGGPAFHAELAGRDPAGAARIRPTDRQRLVRAWEVVEATGRPLSDWQVPVTPWPAEQAIRFQVYVVRPERPALYAACDARFAAMVANGAVAEAEAVRACGLDPDLPGMKALGLRELMAHLEGGLTLAQAIAKAQQATRNYAKRQLTWFRNQLAGANFIVPEWQEAQLTERFLREIFNNIRNSG